MVEGRVGDRCSYQQSGSIWVWLCISEALWERQDVCIRMGTGVLIEHRVI